MSFDLMVLDKRKRFSKKGEFLKWYDTVTEWSDDVDYSDYRHTTPSLQKWFLAMKDIVPPLNGEFATLDENSRKSEFQESDYCIAKEAIYVAFAWSDAEKIHPLVAELAKKNDVAFFDISRNQVVYPDGYILDLSAEEHGFSIWNKLKSLFQL